MPTEPSGPIVVPVANQGGRIYMLELDASGRLKVLIDAITSALTVTATDLDLRNLVKTQDELYAVLRTDAAAAYDARDRNWTITETVPVTQTTPANLLGGIHGYDGAAWQKLPLLWGYTDRLSDRKYLANAVAGYNRLTLTTVPTGEVWLLTSLAAMDSTSAPSRIDLLYYDGTNDQYLDNVLSPAAAKIVRAQGPIVLKPGDYAAADFYGATVNDDLYAWANGYKMAIS